jgi:hypothetical protein
MATSTATRNEPVMTALNVHSVVRSVKTLMTPAPDDA